MVASPVPIYLGCAGLIVGSLGLGAHYMLGGNSVSATDTRTDKPLFARSVEEASLPAPSWPSNGVGVAHYQPMVELLATPVRSTQPPPATAAQPQNPPQTAQPPQQEQRAAPREAVRDLAPPPARQSRRARNQRNQPPADEAMASTEQADPRAARSQARRDGGSQRYDRRSRELEDAEVVDASRSDRRRFERDERPLRDGERRVVVREEIREPEPRIFRGPEQGGSSPFGLFGIFDR